MARVIWMALGVGLGIGLVAAQKQTKGSLGDRIGAIRDGLADRLDERLDRAIEGIDRATHHLIDGLRAHPFEGPLGGNDTEPVFVVTETYVTEI